MFCVYTVYSVCRLILDISTPRASVVYKSCYCGEPPFKDFSRHFPNFEKIEEFFFSLLFVRVCPKLLD